MSGVRMLKRLWLKLTSDPYKLVRMLDEQDMAEEVRVKLIGMGAAAIPALFDSIHSRRYQVHLVLIAIPDARTIPGLRKCLEEYIWCSTARDTITALVKLGWKPETIRETTFHFYFSNDLQGLATVGAPAVPDLISMLDPRRFWIDGGKTEYVDRVKEALLQIGHRSIEELNTALVREDYVSGTQSADFVKSLLDVMCRLADQRAAPALIKFIRRNNSYWGNLAIDVLATLRCGQELLELLPECSTPHKREQELCLVKALERLKERNAIVPLEERLAIIGQEIESGSDWMEVHRNVSSFNAISDVLHALGSPRGDFVYHLEGLGFRVGGPPFTGIALLARNPVPPSAPLEG